MSVLLRAWQSSSRKGSCAKNNLLFFFYGAVPHASSRGTLALSMNHSTVDQMRAETVNVCVHMMSHRIPLNLSVNTNQVSVDRYFLPGEQKALVKEFVTDEGKKTTTHTS